MINHTLANFLTLLFIKFYFVYKMCYFSFSTDVFWVPPSISENIPTSKSRSSQVENRKSLITIIITRGLFKAMAKLRIELPKMVF